MSRLFHFYPQQTWGCVMCGKCCGRDWPVPVDKEERARISAMDLPEVRFPKKKWFSGTFISKKNGKCIFSTCDGKRCLIHAKFGLDVKALACRLYPLDIHAWEDGSISASLRYDCPAVANGTDNNISTAIVKIDQMADEIARYRKDPAPFYSHDIHPSLDRLREIAGAYAGIFNYSPLPLAHRFLAAAELLLFHKQKENASDILEAEDFAEDAIQLLERSLENLAFMLDHAKDPVHSTMIAFRYQLVSYLRNDNGLTLFSRFSRMKKHLDFMLGGTELEISGKKLTPLLPVLAADDDAYEPFLRWLNGRLQSLHFCGGAAFGLTFEEGMQFLLLSYPAVTVIASALAEGEILTRKDIAAALIQLDYSFLRTKLYRNRNLRKGAAALTSRELYLSLLKMCSCGK
ncbi:MAG: YkgJ family cysteine cluster protein [Lentisphaeria bacterium]|nr:YkgJ family cysteine cluster protein [Lentisphaeria bacterium]